MSESRKVIILILWLVVPFIMLPITVYKKTKSIWAASVTVIIPFIMFVTIVSFIPNKNVVAEESTYKLKTEIPTEIPIVKPTDSPQKSYDKWVESSFSVWDGSCIALVSLLKRNLNDADSFEHVETRYITNTDLDTLTIEMTYRAKNAFGAKVLNTCTAIASKSKDTIMLISNE